MTHPKKPELAELVEELVLETRLGERRGASLLAQLRRATYGDLGRTKGGASSGAPVPLDFGAFTLWEDIAGQIDSAFASATDMRPHRSPEVSLMAWHVAFTAATARGETTPLMQDVALERVEKWATRIREYFAAPKTREVMVPCPNCGYLRITLGEEGEEQEVEVFTLVATIRDDQVRVACRNPLCIDAFAGPSEWTGVQLAELGRRTDHEISEKQIRDALRQPSSAPVEPTPRRVMPFDAADTDALELLRDRIRREVDVWRNTPRGRDGDYMNLRATIEGKLSRQMIAAEHEALVEHLRAIGAVRDTPLQQ